MLQQSKQPAGVTNRYAALTIAFLIALSGTITMSASDAAEIILRNQAYSVVFNPATLEFRMIPDGRPQVSLFGPVAKPGQVEEIEITPERARWKLGDRGWQFTVQLFDDSFHVDCVADAAGTLDWLRVASSPAVKGWILPLFEGVYVPAGDELWGKFLAASGTLNTTADLTLPFWGLDYGDFTVTCILTNPFNNQVNFENADHRLQMQVSHEFTRNQPVKQFGVRVALGTASPIEPARQYRRWIQSRGEFVSLREKISKTPDVEKLRGAPHVYLWGEDLLCTEDVRDWKGLVRQIRGESQAAGPSAGKHLWSLLDDESQEAFIAVASAEFPDRYTKGLVAGGISRILERPEFFDDAAWREVSVDEATAALMKQKSADLTVAEICRRNCGLFAAAYRRFVASRETWGDGLSPRMIQQLADDGLDRLWLGAADWSGLVKQPETVHAARKNGFLIGTYDSYHSIHPPGATDTWPTAQFDADLFRTGPIIQADGSKRHGFKGKGFILSPLAARPYVERRIIGLMRSFPANSWFMDCDGFGEFFDDYSDAHPATQQTDLQERMARIGWIRDTYGAAVGSEGCSAGAAATLHFAHGVMTPVIGWGDADLTSKQSKYYLGSYYPPHEPAVFFKTVPLKEKYRALYFDARYRLPLFQVVFHDSVVATHHWSAPSFKFTEAAQTVELLELLYNVPPLYHLNRAEFQRRKDGIKAHFEFFSPLHRELSLLPLTDFQWLTEDRLVQRTVFGDRIDLLANFGDAEFTGNNVNVTPHSIAAIWRDGSKRMFFAAKSP